MAKDLELSLQLPISDANVGLIGLIAQDSGWDAEKLLGAPDINGNPTAPISAEDFVCIHILIAHMEKFFSEKVEMAIANQYGRSQDAMKAAVLEQLKQELVVAVEIKDRA